MLNGRIAASRTVQSTSSALPIPTPRSFARSSLPLLFPLHVNLETNGNEKTPDTDQVITPYPRDSVMRSLPMLQATVCVDLRDLLEGKAGVIRF